MVTVLRPLSLSELLDRTFFLYRKHFVLFVGIVALPQLAVLAVNFSGAMLGLRGSLGGTILISFVAIVVNVIALTASHAATVIAVSNVHLEQPITIGGAFSAIGRRLLSIVGIMFGIELGTGIAFLFLIAPGVYLALTWALSIPVTVLEKTGLGGTTNRSATLTKGDKGRIFVVVFLMLVLIWFATIIIGIPIILLVALTHAKDPAAAQGWMTIFTSISSFISTSLVGPLMTIALTLLYYDNRVRKEGFDLQLMMATMQRGPRTISAATS